MISFYNFGFLHFAPCLRPREYARAPSCTPSPSSDPRELELAARRAAARDAVVANIEAVRGYTRGSSSLYVASSPSTPSPSSALSELERHLYVLGTRAAALDSAAANTRRHVEALRGNPHTNTPTATAGVGAQQNDLSTRFLRTVAARRDVAQTQGDLGASSSTGAGATGASLPAPSAAATTTATSEAQAHAARTELPASARVTLDGVSFKDTLCAL
ncbi:hypothetical protein MSAN_01171500 [Mycena sanguinolenta]|uniref:Uncharacterized protein n=1 Tax=Mycena sanguinolenta TaxID=230812 RepID=A0A8H6YNA9_9AGAR|nr:hypothetical protein MSAN_01171500 [Mycena sanguinolenta]